MPLAPPLPVLTEAAGSGDASPRGRSRRAPFSPIERLSDTRKGQFRFERPDGGFDYRDILLESSQGARGVWRKVYTSPKHGTKAFKLSPVTDDS